MVALSFTVAGVIAIVGLVVLSAFFSSSESAIFSISPELFDATEAADDRELDRLRDLRSDPHRLLVTILVGNNVVNMAIASITTALMVTYLPAGPAVSVATLLASFLVLVFGEIVPKSYGLGHARQWSLRVAGPIWLVERVFYPVVVVFDVLTRRLNAMLGGEAIETAQIEE